MQANALFQNRPPLWLYYENPYYQWRRPEYLNLCLETVQRHCGRSFRVIPLTRYDVYKYLPDLRKDVWVKCTAAQRMDLIRWELLSRYGGLCLDPDVLVAGDECYVEGNYTDEVPLGPGLLWSERDWFESLQTVKELERRTGGDVLFGHDLARFESFGDGWNV